jgi:hypothetical protein
VFGFLAYVPTPRAPAAIFDGVECCGVMTDNTPDWLLATVRNAARVVDRTAAPAALYPSESAVLRVSEFPSA